VPRPETMLLHIPDGFLSVGVALACWVLMVLVQGLASRRALDVQLGGRAPLLGIMAAFIFAAQMINFPVAGGTSGHLLGGTLAAIVLGPWPAMLAMAAVIGTQAVLFQDGGILALGANILNMGVATVAIGFGVYRPFAGASRPIRLGAAAVGAWLSVVASAALTAIQLAVSGTVAFALVMPAMVGVHTLIGVGEALITVAALSFILSTRPDLIDATAGAGGRMWSAVGLGVALIAAALSPFASADPDGLERVAEDLGFEGLATSAPFAVLGDYLIPGIEDPALATILAGVLGMTVVLGLAIGASRLWRREPAPG